MDQETLNKMMQVASRELRIPISSIRIGECSSTIASDPNSIAPPCGDTVHVMAVQEACQTLLQRLQPIISVNPETTWRGCIAQAFHHRICLSAANHYRVPDPVSASDWKDGTESPDFIFGAACTEVELDCRTGKHKNLRTDIVIDVGSSVNQAATIEQVTAAFKQGLGLYTNGDITCSLQPPLKGAKIDQEEAVSGKAEPNELNVTLLPSSPTPDVGYFPKAVEEVATFLGSSVFFAIKDAVLAARHHIGLPGTILLPVPIKPQDIQMVCGNHLVETEKTSDKETLTLQNHVAET